MEIAYIDAQMTPSGCAFRQRLAIRLINEHFDGLVSLVVIDEVSEGFRN